MTLPDVALFLIGLALVVLILRDAFHTIVIPKTVEHRFQVSNFYYRAIWNAWHWLYERLGNRSAFRRSLVAFGPLSLIFLFVVWATFLVLGFASMHLGLHSLGRDVPLSDYIYYSGVTFFTLGYGDMAPITDAGRLLALFHVASGYGFLAIDIGFVPTFYSFFSRRERFIVMMDSRAGSNPSAGLLLSRYASAGAMNSLADYLRDAEAWCAEQLEAYLSYPVLAYYRSQHDDQSWLSTMTTVLDTSALLLAGLDHEDESARALRFQAQSTFAMARHVIVDLAYILDDPPAEEPPSRMSPIAEQYLREVFDRTCDGFRRDAFERLAQYRAQYEPYLVGLAQDLIFVLPAWTPMPDALDNWEISAWDGDKHF